MYVIHNAPVADEGIIAMDEQEIALRKELKSLRERHRNLDEAVVKIESNQQIDQLHLRRLKKDKLMLRDKILMIEDMLNPDIIA